MCRCAISLNCSFVMTAAPETPPAAVSSDIQINAVRGLIVHVDIAVVIIYRGDRPILIIPQVFFGGDPSGAEAACKGAAGMAAAEARMTCAAAGGALRAKTE